MAANTSFLSDPKYNYGCDFVVATTQASINSSLWEYLEEGSQPVQYLAFLSSPTTGNPTIETSLEDLLKKTGGVSPFDIPAGTPYTDPRIKFLNKARFAIGIKIQMGIPPGCTPDDTSIVRLGKDAKRVTFNMLCAQITVIQNHKDQFDDDLNSWNVWEQTSGDPWIIETEVDLVVKDLDKNLDESPYLRKNTKIRDQLKNALDNLSGTAFSLQQLLFDLDNAVLQRNYRFATDIKDPDVQSILQTRFLKLYADSAKDHGWPMISVTAVPQVKDDSTLQMTALERTVSLLRDNQGNEIENPDADQQAVTTLNYLCVVDKPRPSPDTKFSWNWVGLEDVNQESGVVAINRNTLADIIIQKLEPQVAAITYIPKVDSGASGGFSFSTPKDFKLKREESGVYLVTHRQQNKDMGKVTFTATNGQPQTDRFMVLSEVDVSLSVYKNTVYLDQSLRIWIGYTMYVPGEEETPYGMNVRFPVVRKLSTTYNLSVDDVGGLQLTKTHEEPTNEDDRWADDEGMIYPGGQDDRAFRTEVYFKMFDKIADLHLGDLHEMQIGLAHNFIFPGAKVFTYKNPRFSDCQDLICDITYVDPTTQVSQPKPQPTKLKHRTKARAKKQLAEEHVLGSPEIGTKGKLTASTELMQNYVQGEIISPTGKFEALQTGGGHTLLFAVDSAGVFNVIEEQSGASHTGWKVHDLSTAVIQQEFASRAGATTVRTFDVGHSVLDGTIGLMMAVSVDGGGDQLLLSLGNSRTDTSWLASPTWINIPFDAKSEAIHNITIASTMFAETWGRKQFVVVDIQRPSVNNSDPHIARYHINAAATTGPRWLKHDVTVDISADKYQSVVGRVAGKKGDGIYTVGTAGGQPQLVYEPIINYYGIGPVTPRRLKLPKGTTPSAITTARNADGSSDLYIVGNQTLYRLASDEQDEDTEPTALVTSPLLAGTENLQVVIHGTVAVLWGRNASNQVFYTASRAKHAGVAKAWKLPMLILSGVERVSPYINIADGGITIFAAGGGRLQKLVQGSAATGRIWRSQDIKVAPSTPQKAIGIKSYTTSIHVKHPEKDVPAPYTGVSLSANTRTPVYVNGIYFVLGSTPTQVITDTTGCLTIVEATDSLHSAVLTASLDGHTVTINPMDASFDKIAALNSAEKLRAAQLPDQTVAGGIVGSPAFAPLVDASADDGAVAAVAKHMDIFKDAYLQMRDTGTGNPMSQTAMRSKFAALPGGRKIKPINFGFLDDLGDLVDDVISDVESVADDVISDVESVADDVISEVESIADDVISEVKSVVSDVVHTVSDVVDTVEDVVDDVIKTVGDVAKDIGNAVSSVAGDVLQAAKDDINSVGRIVQDTVNGTLHLVTKIGGTVYKAILDTTHAVVGALEWLFDKIKTGVMMLIRFVEMLFSWDDIRRTKDVMYNIVKLWIHDQADNVSRVKQLLDSNIKAVESKINTWANIDDWAPKLGDVAQKPASGSAADVSKSMTSDARFLSDKYRDHGDQMQILGDSPALDAVQELLMTLITAVANEGEVLGALFQQLQDLVSQFDSLSVQDILKRIIAILIDGTLSSLQVVMDALLSVLSQLVKGALSILDTKLHIPIISDILNAIGVPDISFLDLFTWIGSLAVTVIFKAINGRAPFADSHASSISSASSFDELAALFGQQSPSKVLSSTPSHSANVRVVSLATEHNYGIIPMPLDVRKSIFEACYLLAGVLGWINNPIQGIEAEDQTDNTLIGISSAILAFVLAASDGAGSVLAPLESIEFLPIKVHSYITKTVGIVNKVVFSSPFQWVSGKVGTGRLAPQSARGLKSIIDGALCFHGFVGTTWHFFELSQKPDSTAVNSAIIDEMANLADYVSRISYAIAVNDEEQDSRVVAIMGMAVANYAYTGLKFAESQVGKSAFT
ncbi:hypothetical protein TARUN_2052 [Trichoderma arundinaceum]|uniref:Gamma-glutamyltranspeptidase periplasmic n=1 Tax=Trichoderma arundinaceum TaxID=490622 RepID=A0A395NVT4_TRIAR|nr:hypothetical protein TARUN_2052 [Trichoderma arundinaceum]